MKTLEMTVLASFAMVVAIAGCHEQLQEKRTQLILDSEVSGKDVTIVPSGETVGPVESITDISELTTIMQYDIDAMQRIPSKEIVYVKPGEPVRPAEKRL